MSKFVIETDGDSPTYGKVHRAGCRNCKDPYPMGDTFDEIVENWPWPEERDYEGWIADSCMPCAKGLLR